MLGLGHKLRCNAPLIEAVEGYSCTEVTVIRIYEFFYNCLRCEHPCQSPVLANSLELMGMIFQLSLGNLQPTPYSCVLDWLFADDYCIAIGILTLDGIVVQHRFVLYDICCPIEASHGVAKDRIG